MNGHVHNFRDSLQASHEQEDSPYWLVAYRKAFPTLASAVSVRQDGWAQRGGIDRVLTLECGRQVTIDEKVRAKDYGDILLERWSDVRRKIDGWIVKPLACDYIAYAILPIRTCYLFPTLDLQRAWRSNGKDWMANAHRSLNGFRYCHAVNERYVTVSVAVPKAVLFDAIRETMAVTWADAA